MNYRTSSDVVPRAAYDALADQLTARETELAELAAARRQGRSWRWGLGVLFKLCIVVLVLAPTAFFAAFGFGAAQSAERTRVRRQRAEVENATREARAFWRATDGRDVRDVRCDGTCGTTSGELRCRVTLVGDTTPNELCCDPRDAAESDGCVLILDPAFE